MVTIEKVMGCVITEDLTEDEQYLLRLQFREEDYDISEVPLRLSDALFLRNLLDSILDKYHTRNNDVAVKFRYAQVYGENPEFPLDLES